ncbi:MAG: hypothetical protein ABR985_20420 [Methanotrichaceae archaeon]|jgi:hypothetical protein
MQLMKFKPDMDLIGTGLFMLAALAHVAQASDAGDLSHYIGVNCTSTISGG